MTERAGRPVRDLLARSVVVTAAGGLLCSAVALGVRGWSGLLGGILAATLVVSFLLVGQLPVAAASRGRGCLGAGLLIALYVLRILLLLGVYAAVLSAASDTVDQDAMGITVIVCALAWTAATVWTAVRWKPTLIDPKS